MARIGYHNPVFDGICAQADAEPDPAKRSSLYARANALLMHDVPALPVTFPPGLVLCHTNVTGWQSNLCFVLPYTHTTKSAR
jgi:ABC-type oligopeptide transport system substrate-binding subunit